jgi:hypothetical protein
MSSANPGAPSIRSATPGIACGLNPGYGLTWQ